jgi:hypothetical protein
MSNPYHFFVEANTIIYLFNLLCNDLINFKACTMREPASYELSCLVEVCTVWGWGLQLGDPRLRLRRPGLKMSHSLK